MLYYRAECNDESPSLHSTPKFVIRRLKGAVVIFVLYNNAFSQKKEKMKKIINAARGRKRVRKTHVDFCFEKEDVAHENLIRQAAGGL